MGSVKRLDNGLTVIDAMKKEKGEKKEKYVAEGMY